MFIRWLYYAQVFNRFAPPPAVSDPGPDKYLPTKYMPGGTKRKRSSKKDLEELEKMPWVAGPSLHQKVKLVQQ